ncbi:hypothetical protein BDV93DRAFT_108260 [Ceratobasidium sp. AG-I]|nr:hypothetical protein BDV93DRAFT_108260 [Ceratobasidium sp. AG-I]
MQETVGRIKTHKAYQMLDENGNYTWTTRWLILWAILVSTPGFILSSVLRFARLFALKEPEPANGSIPSPAGLPGENMFRPENSSIQRGRGVNTAVGLVPPFSV